MTEPADRIEEQLMSLEDEPQAIHDTTVCNLHKELETLANDLRNPAPDDPHEAESACRRAVEQVQTLASRQTATNAGAPGEETSELKPGTIIGQYQVLGKIGQGGMGAVYKARHTKLDKTVALKLLPEERLEKSDALARFEREMKAVGKIEHPNLVRALDAGEDEGSHYLVMEYVDGLDLSRLIKERQKLPVTAACELVRQAALGLQAAHQSGMVHRDIKPANLMLARQEFGPPVVKVLDLGLARLANDGGPLETELTTDNQIMGTLDFMAPEQAGNSRRVDTRVDVYSLGATLFTLLTGQPPYHGPAHQTIIQKLSALANQPLPDIRNLRSNVPAGLVTVLEKMLAKDKTLRYQEPVEVAEALTPFAQNADLAGLLEEAKTTTSTPSLVRSTATWAAPSTDPTVGFGKPARQRTMFIAGIIVLALVPLLFFYAGTIIRFATNQGELVIEIDDPDIEVQVIQNGAIVQDKTNDREFTLTAANGQIEVYEKDGIKLATKEFQLTRGGKTTVKVTLQELADARKPKPVPENKPGTPSSVPAENYALAFDGEDDFVEIPIRYADGNPPFSVEAYVVPSRVGDRRHAVISSGQFWICHGPHPWPPYSGRPVWAAIGTAGDGSGSYGASVKWAVKPDQRVHVAAVWDGEELILFVGGVRQASRALNGGLRGKGYPFKIGAVPKGYGKEIHDYFDGVIDEVRFSKIARYTKDFTPAKRFEPDEHTLALYHFDEGQGDVLKDSSGNGHHGKIVGAKWVKLNSEREIAEWALKQGATLHVVERPEPHLINDLNERKSPSTVKDLPGFKTWAAKYGGRFVRIPDDDFLLVGIAEIPYNGLIAGIRMSAADVRRLGALPHLRYLSLTPSDAETVGELGALKELRELYVFSPRGADLQSLRQLPHLWRLEIGGFGGASQREAGERLKTLSGIPSLRSLMLFHCGFFSEDALRSLENTRLENIGLAQLDKASEPGIRFLKEIPTLKSLLLADFAPSNLGFLSELKQIERLVLYHNSEYPAQLTDDKLKPLHSLNHLKEMILVRTKVTQTGIEQLHQALPNCKITWDGGVVEPKSDATDPDREVAEWVISLGGNVEYRKDKQFIRIATAIEIPTEPFQIFRLDLQDIKEIDDAEMARLAALKAVNTLYLHGTAIGDAGLAELGKLSSLGELHMHRTQVTDAGLVHLSKLEKLYMLFMSQTKITDAGLQHLSGLPNLRFLNLNYTGITDAGAETISKISDLRVIHLTGTRVTDKGLNSLHSLKRLEEAVLVSTKVTKAGIDQFHEALPNCKITWDGGVVGPGTEAVDTERRVAEAVLRSGGTLMIKTKAAEYDVRRMERIEDLPLEPFDVTGVYFTNVKGITDEHLAELAGLEWVAYVHLQNTKITDAGLAHLAKLPSLQMLNLYGTQVTEAGLKLLAELPRLTMLNLSATPLVQAGMESLRMLEWVRILHMHGKMTRSRFMELAQLKNLRELLVSSEAQITEADVAKFQETNPYCRVFIDNKLVGADPVREVAQELHEKGATLTIGFLNESSGYQDFPPEKPLPSETFGVRAVAFSKHPTLKDEDLSRLHAFPYLYKVYLSSTNITDTGVEHLKSCRHLGDVWLHGTKITDRTLEVLSELPLLWGVHVVNTGITNAGVAKLAASESLHMLEISNTRADGQSLDSIAQMPKLEQLHLKYLNIGDEDLPKLNGMSKLRILSLNATKVTKEGVEQLHKALPQCKITWDGGVVEPSTGNEP